MSAHAQGELLAQVRPSVTTAVTLFTADKLRVEATLLVACLNTSGTGVEVAVYHDDDGTTYDGTTIIGLSTLGGTGTQDSFKELFKGQHPGSGILIKPGGSIGVKAATADAVTFSLYGISAQVAERIRGTV